MSKNTIKADPGFNYLRLSVDERGELDVISSPIIAWVVSDCDGGVCRAPSIDGGVALAWGMSHWFELPLCDDHEFVVFAIQSPDGSVQGDSVVYTTLDGWKAQEEPLLREARDERRANQKKKKARAA